MESEEIMRLIEAVSASELTHFKYEEKGIKLSMGKETKKLSGNGSRHGKSARNEENDRTTVGETVTAKTETVSVEGNDAGEEREERKIVTAPLVGTFYAAPQEGAEPFVTKGSTVRKGQVLAIVEAMKLMNEIESEFDGVVTEICVENGEAVEYGQPLFKISSR